MQLIRAAIAGINAIWSASPQARIVNVDPVCRVVAPGDRPDLVEAAEAYNEQAVYEGWDMLCGRLLPELGGSRKHLDIVGVNYYWTNQWELGRDEVALAESDPRLLSLRELVGRVWKRYGGDLLITETAHVSEKRAGWIDYVAQEAEALLDEGIPLRGVCLYPILGMPEWHEPERWTSMGLWDLVLNQQTLSREICSPMYEALRFAQRLEERHRKLRGEGRAAVRANPI